MSNNQQIATPQIRFFQFESEKLGVFEKSVNLFRGDLNFSRTLFTMPSRPGRKDLDVNVSVQYQSNLQETVTTQNLVAPTGILGLGWSMPLGKISLQVNGALSKANRSYLLQDSGINSQLVLTKIENGKEYYEAVDYEFWIIVYDPETESWEITHENGTTYIYGGGLGTTAQGNNTSRGNSIAWGVRYGNWVGNTSLTASGNPTQFAREWYLSEIRNAWGDNVQYEYNGFARGADGLITGIEQFVGDTKGKPYTKAVYLTKITDVFNRTAVFQYGEKTFDNSSPDAPKEYQAANSKHPDIQAPNGFQDLYETKYLNCISVNTATGSLLKNILFDYHLLKNLTSFTGALKGFTYKRYLKSITSCAPDNSSLPGLSFDYYWDSDINLGALKTVTIPQGAIATYTYQMNSLDICHRKMQIPRPDKSIMGSDNSIPRVWFGHDFAVVTWFNIDSGKLWMGIYTWVGYWKLWNPDNAIIYNQSAGIDQSSLNVEMSDTSFGLHFNDGNNTYLYVYGKDLRQTGKWISYEEPESGFISLPFPSTEVSFISGRSFILVNQAYINENKQLLTRITWNWKEQKWITEENVYSTNYNNLLIAGTNEYYLTLTLSEQNNTASLQLNYLSLDPANTISWLPGGQLTLANVPSDIKSFYCSPGESIASLMVIVNTAGSSIQYDIHALSWDEEYQPAVQSFTNFRTLMSSENIVPRVFANSLITNGEYSLRYNGSTWMPNASLEVKHAPGGNDEYWFAYGNDFVLRTINGQNTGIKVDLLVYDPDNPAEVNSWTSTPFHPEPLPPPNHSRYDYYPTAGAQDYFTSGKSIYYRGSSTSWKTPANTPVFTIQDNINSTTLINQAPNFLAYVVPDNNNKQNSKTVVLELKNGNVIGPGVTLPSQICSLPGNKPGMQPYGPGSFITFPADTDNGNMDHATELILYRYAGNAIQGNIIHYPVSCLQVSDGFGSIYSTAYEFDAGSAACDPSGTTVKYYKSAMYPGTTDPKQPVSGKMVTHYINGYNNLDILSYFLNGQPVSDQPAYPVLDGLKMSVEIFDNADQLVPVQRQDFTWDIFTLRNSNAVRKDPVPVQLYGSYTRQHSIEQVLDGVKETSGYNYIPAGFNVPFSGLPVNRYKTNFNGEGKEELLTTSTVYGYEKYPALAALNLIDVTVQETQSVTPVGGDLQPGVPVTAGVKATTLKEWQPGKWGNYQSFTWKGTVNADFPFPADYSKPAGWLCEAEITAVDPFGLLTEIQDTTGNSSSILYDKNSEYCVAQFKNGSIANGEADYYGFGETETGAGWSLNNNARIVDGSSYTGTQSLELDQGGSFSKTYQPGSRKAFVMGYWYKTLPGYLPGSNSGWQLQATGMPAVEKPFADTKGKWVFDYALLDLTGHTGTIKVNAISVNNSSGKVWIDNVRWVPKLSDFSAYIYKHGILTTQLGIGSILERVFYDQFNQRTASVSSYKDQLDTLYLNYFSLSGNNGVFNTLDPNCEVQVKALNGGNIERFTDGQDWQLNWNASSAATNWQTAAGRLVHSNTSVSDTLTYAAMDPGSDYVLSFCIESTDRLQPLVLTDAVGIKIGSDTSISWDPAQKKWMFMIAGASQSPLWNNGQPPRCWTLIVKPETLLFFGDGRLLLSLVTRLTAAKPISLFTGKNALAFSSLAIGLKPMTGLTYKDALGNSRQNHALCGANALINQHIYNPLGKKIVKTKSAPAIFGNTGAGIPLLTYRSGFVDVAGFLQNMDGSGVMTGDLSNYYNGNNGESNDENYPYRRRLLERSPLARQLEMGLPGKDRAIIDPWTSDPAKRKTVKYAYTNNKDTTVPGIEDLPVGEYYVMIQTQENGTPAYQVKDKTTSVIMNGMAAAQSNGEFEDEGEMNPDPVNEQPEDPVLNKTGTAAPNLINRRHVIHNGSGRTVIQRFPSYYNNQSPDNKSFQAIREYDTLNNLLSLQTADNGITRLIQGSDRKLRFQQDAEGAAKGYFGYYKYDSLNRITEKGILHQDWDAVALAVQADQPDYPTGLSGQQIQKTMAYVNYGDSDHALGSISSVTTFSEDESGTTVTENYTYDDRGRAHEITTLINVNGKLKGEYKVGYEYLGAGLMSKVDYPAVAGSDIGTVYYFYDDLGRMVSIGRSHSEKDYYASYTFTAENSMASRKLNQGGLVSNMQYYSPGWLQSMQDAVPGFSETIPAYNSAGSVKSVADILKGGPVNTSLTINAGYNSNNLLNSVTCSPEEEWSLADVQYDLNGNLTSLSANGIAEKYVYSPGTNQVNQLMTNGVVAQAFTYNKNGGVSSVSSSGQNLEFTYLKNGYLTTAAKNTTSGDTSSFYYGTQNRRFFKRVTDASGMAKSEKISIFGCHGLPLVEMTDKGPVLYIYGKEGLVAFEKKQQLYFVVKDHLGSNRMVFDTNNQVKASYSYSSFGQNKILYEAEAGLLTFLYTGQEWLEELDLYNFRARLYSSRLRRFYQTDPKNQYVGAYVFNAENPLSHTDPTGMTSGEWHWYDALGEWLISLVEIVVGIVLDVVSLGTLTDIGGGTLLGGGLNTLGSLIIGGGGTTWLQFGEAEAIGVVTGTISAGIGALGGMAADAITGATDTAGKFLANGAIKMVAGAVGGVAANVSGAAMDNHFKAMDAQGHGGTPPSAEEGLGEAALIGLTSGAFGGAVGAVGQKIATKFAQKGIKVFTSIVGGILAGAATVGFTVAFTGKFSWEDFGINLAGGVFGAISAPLKVERVYNPMDIQNIPDRIQDIADLTGRISQSVRTRYQAWQNARVDPFAYIAMVGP